MSASPVISPHPQWQVPPRAQAAAQTPPHLQPRSQPPLSQVFRDDTTILMRRVEGHLATLRLAPHRHDVALAERLAGSLRELVASTVTASAADRAQVRAAVHYFVMRRRRLARALVGDRRMIIGDLRVVNDTARRLGRDDLVVEVAGRTP